MFDLIYSSLLIQSNKPCLLKWISGRAPKNVVIKIVFLNDEANLVVGWLYINPQKWQRSIKRYSVIYPGKSVYSTLKSTCSTHRNISKSCSQLSENARHIHFPGSTSGECFSKSSLLNWTGTARRRLSNRQEIGGKKIKRSPNLQSRKYLPPRKSATFPKTLSWKWMLSPKRSKS